MTMNKRFKVTALSAAIAAAGAVMPAYGYEYVQDDFRMQVDTTVSVGASWRASERDYRGVGNSNAAAAFAVGKNPANTNHLHGTSSQDNSNLLWKEGSTFSEVAKITVDVEMNYKNYGAFIRGKAFYDHRIVNGDGVTDLPEYYRTDANGQNLDPNQSDGRSADILDAFVWGDWWIGDHPLNVRLGQQVISWGEGIFFANGINTINPIDVQALLAPGSELKDALIPLNALYGSFGVNENLTLEGFVLFDWEETKLPPCGTFFSTTDIIGDNCYGGFYPGGRDSNEPGATATLLMRGSDQEPDDSGQFGLAARYFVDSIETEFAFYYINYHSRLPVTSGYMPDPATSALAPLFGWDENTTLAQARTAIQTNGSLGTLSTYGLFPTTEYFVEYPEDIQLFGVSFNTALDIGLPGGATSISGEFSMRKDQPFSQEDGSTLAGLAGLPSTSCGKEYDYDCYARFEPGDYSQGYVQEDYYQAEIAFIHFFDRILGASRWTAILDIAGGYSDFANPDEYTLNSAYNATLNMTNRIPDSLVITGVFNPIFGGATQVPYDVLLAGLNAAGITDAATPESDYYPSHGAWGYKMRFSGEYNNVFAGINLRPTISFSHDVSGTTATPITTFLENRKALGLSVEGVYQNTYTMKLAYTDFYGAEPYNQLADRDFYSISASASF
jgi:hypothetical protein